MCHYSAPTPTRTKPWVAKFGSRWIAFCPGIHLPVWRSSWKDALATALDHTECRRPVVITPYAPVTPAPPPAPFNSHKFRGYDWSDSHIVVT